MVILETRLCVFAAAWALFSQVAAERIQNCTVGISGNEYIADDSDLCVYYHCRNGLPTEEWPATCAKGTRLPSYYNKSSGNPCTEFVSNSQCLRCNIKDVQRKLDVVTDYCALWTPCDAGCICHNEVEGYWCDCSGSLSTLPALPTFVPQCTDPAYCFNGGTCHKLYDTDPFCNCVPGWTGKRCESKICDWNPCKNNGTCVFNGTRIYCLCDRCHRGSCCETLRIEDPDCIGCPPCKGGLNCTGNRDWKCSCTKCNSDEELCSNGPLNGNISCNRGAATAGSRFTLMFMENTGANVTMEALELYITSGEDDNRSRTVEVSAPRADPSCSFFQRVVIAPRTVAPLKVPLRCRHDGTNVENKGIRVQEVNNETVTVYGINRAAFSADSFLAIPDRSAGKSFVAVCYPTAFTDGRVDFQSQIGIVALEDNTWVNLTLSNPLTAELSGRRYNVTSDHTYIVHLNAFQTYQIQAYYYNRTADLTGTIIVSNKSIHVLSGNKRTSVIIDRAPVKDVRLSTDHLVEEMPPAETWGKTYAIVPIPNDVLGYNSTLELIRVVGSFDTKCTVYSSTGKTDFEILTERHWFHNFSVDAADNYFLDCSQPVLIMAITASAHEGVNETERYNDPAMIYIPAVNQYTNYYTFAPPRYSVTGNPYNYTLAVLAANSTTYFDINVNGVPTSELVALKKWSLIAPSLPISDSDGRPPLYGGIFRVSNSEKSIIRHPVKQVRFMCIIYCYANRESIGHVGGSALSFSNDLQEGTGLSQWQWVQHRNHTYIN